MFYLLSCSEARQLEERMHGFLSRVERRRGLLDMSVAFYSHSKEVSSKVEGQIYPKSAPYSKHAVVAVHLCLLWWYISYQYECVSAMNCLEKSDMEWALFHESNTKSKYDWLLPISCMPWALHQRSLSLGLLVEIGKKSLQRMITWPDFSSVWSPWRQWAV